MQKHDSLGNEKVAWRLRRKQPKSLSFPPKGKSNLKEPNGLENRAALPLNFLLFPAIKASLYPQISPNISHKSHLISQKPFTRLKAVQVQKLARKQPKWKQALKETR